MNITISTSSERPRFSRPKGGFKKGQKVKVTDSTHELYGKKLVVSTTTPMRRGKLSNVTSVHKEGEENSLVVDQVRNDILKLVK